MVISYLKQGKTMLIHFVLQGMLPKELEKFKIELLEEKERLEQELNKIANLNPKAKGRHYNIRFPEYGRSQDENALEASDMDRLQVIEGNLEQRLNDINKTLEKIKKGVYGICESCSVPIEDKRLKAIPVASFCIYCAKKNL